MESESYSVMMCLINFYNIHNYIQWHYIIKLCCIKHSTVSLDAKITCYCWTSFCNNWNQNVHALKTMYFAFNNLSNYEDKFYLEVARGDEDRAEGWHHTAVIE